LSLAGDTLSELAADETHDSAARRPGGRDTLKSELADAVSNDPEAAVSVLRTWIRNAS
jgi:flagellar biosynthesis/type III secretory pathway M-ring protein FliF/YscJ